MAARLALQVEGYREQGDLSWGIYNFSNSPACTWHDFAMEIFKQARELNLVITPPVVKAITTVEYPTPAKRPAWSVLDNSKIEALLKHKVPSCKAELTDVLHQLAASN